MSTLRQQARSILSSAPRMHFGGQRMWSFRTVTLFSNHLCWKDQRPWTLLWRWRQTLIGSGTGKLGLQTPWKMLKILLWMQAAVIFRSVRPLPRLRKCWLSTLVSPLCDLISYPRIWSWSARELEKQVNLEQKWQDKFHSATRQ